MSQLERAVLRGTPPSPTFTSTTEATSRSNAFAGTAAPRVVVSRKDLQQSIKAYETLLGSAKAYRNALLALASASGSFAAALENCARQKGAAGVDDEPGYSASERLMAAAGDLKANEGKTIDSAPRFQQSPARSGRQPLQSAIPRLFSRNGAQWVPQNFEIPLLEQLDEHKNAVGERQASYEKQVQAKTKQIRETEAANMKHGRKKLRDLGSFRRALASLQNQVDDLDRLKIAYYSELLDGQAETWDLIASKTSIVVHAEHQLYDRVASKATADPILETMVQSVLDPFGEFDRPEDVEPGIFSILTPMDIPYGLTRVVSPPPMSLQTQTTPVSKQTGSRPSSDGSAHTSPETPRHPRANGSDATVSAYVSPTRLRADDDGTLSYDHPCCIPTA